MARQLLRRTTLRFPAACGAVLVACGLAGCVVQVSPGGMAESRARAVLPAKLALAPLDAEIERTNLRGETVAETKWDAEITNHFQSGLHAALALDPIRADSAPLTSEAVSAELARVRESTRALTVQHARYSSVHSSRAHVATGAVNVGRIDALADALHADAVIFVHLSDRTSSDLRRLATAAPTLAAIPTGVNLPPRSGITVASLAVVARDGDVRWFNVSSTVRDLRFPDDAAQLARRLVADLR